MPTLTEFDLQQALGAREAFSVQRFAIYLPNRDQYEQPVPEFENWVEAAMDILVDVNGGVTRLPIAGARFRVRNEGQADRIIGEDTVVVYSYLFVPERFVSQFDEIKIFIDTFGKLTNQDTVMVEFSGAGYRSSDSEDKEFYMQAYYIKEYPRAVAIAPWLDSS